MDIAEDAPVFSVIIPTYNRRNIVGNAIESVLCQTFDNFELIIVDDGSSDGTQQEISLFTDKRLRYIYKENGGQNSALNAGLRIARGKYMAFLDSDDIWLPVKLEKIYEKYQEDNEISVVYHFTGICKKGGQIIAANADYLEGYIYKQVLEQEFLASQISLSAKRECFEKVNYYDENFRIYQDDDICFLLSKYYKVGLVKEVLSIIGGDANNRITTNRVKKSEDYEKLIEKYKDDILQLCGKQKLAGMYYKAVMLGVDVWRKDEVKRRYKAARKYDIEGRYKNSVLIRDIVFHELKEVLLGIKHNIYLLFGKEESSV